MSANVPSGPRKGYCICVDFFFQGAQPVVSGGDDKYIVFETEAEAQREIADNMMTRLQEFLDGERDYADAITVDEFVVPVTVNPDGTLSDENGNTFRGQVN